MGRPPLRARALATAALVLGIASASGGAVAAPLDPALQGQLLQLYDAFNKAIAADDLDAALAVRSAEAKTSLREGLAKPSERKQAMAFLKLAAPDGYLVLHARLAKDGQSASILVDARKSVPLGGPPGAPPAGTVTHSEITLKYVKEGGAWRFDEPVFGLDPASIKACRSTAYEPIDAYDQDQSTSMGGPVSKVAFEADHTLVIVRVLDEETCVFLPNRETLSKAGFDAAQLVPYAIVEVEGFPHRSDKQKVWGDKITVDDEDCGLPLAAGADAC